MLNTSCPPILSSGTDNPLRMNGSIEVNPSLLHLRLIASHWLHCPQAFKLLIFYQVVDSPLFRHGVPMLVTAMQVFSRLLVWTLAVRRRKDIQKKSCQRGGKTYRRRAANAAEEAYPVAVPDVLHQVYTTGNWKRGWDHRSLGIKDMQEQHASTDVQLRNWQNRHGNAKAVAYRDG